MALYLYASVIVMLGTALAAPHQPIAKLKDLAEAAMGAKHEIHPHILKLDCPGKDAPAIFCGKKRVKKNR